MTDSFASFGSIAAGGKRTCEVDEGVRTAGEVAGDVRTAWSFSNICDARALGPLMKIKSELSWLKEQAIPLVTHLVQIGRVSSHCNDSQAENGA